MNDRLEGTSCGVQGGHAADQGGPDGMTLFGSMPAGACGPLQTKPCCICFLVTKGTGVAAAGCPRPFPISPLSHRNATE